MSGSIRENIYKSDESWYPEDYVHYVDNWKIIQASEVTWEYWKYIKKKICGRSRILLAATEHSHS